MPSTTKTSEPRPAPSTAQVTVEIDGVHGHRARRHVGHARGRARRRQVPKLCATDTLKAFGSCRLCLVEIEGRKGYPASCTTTVAPGMKIRTQSEKLTQLRRGVIDLYVSDHPLECDTCPADQHCELQDMAAEVGITETSYARAPTHWPKTPADVRHDTSNPYFGFNPELCIVCSRCVRACDEVQGTFALTIQGRGFESKVSASQDEPFMESECVSCGACVESCPTGALIEKSIIALGQAGQGHDHHLRVLRRRLLVQGGDARARARTSKSSAWRRIATAMRTTATPASRAASPTATPRTRIASPSR